MIQLGILSDFTDTERAKLEKACELVNQCLADQRFLDELLKAVFDSVDEDDATIVGKLTAPITIMRLYCEYLGWWATHRYRTIAEESEDGTITFNRPFFDGQKIPSLANTLFHETCHAAGYHHASSHDYASVPYEAGNLLEDFATNRLNAPVPAPKIEVESVV